MFSGNLDYVIVSGARRQENRWNPLENEQVVPETKEVSRKLFDDPMYKLEHGTNDQMSSKTKASHLSSLLGRQDSVWKNDFDANRALREKFRQKKKQLKAIADKDSALLTKSSLDLKLLPEHKSDIKLAALYRYKNIKPKLDIKLKNPSATSTSKKHRALSLGIKLPSKANEIPR